MLKSFQTLEKSEFFTLLRTVPIDTSLKDTGRLQTAYGQFADRVQLLSKRGKTSKLDTLHTLARIRENLVILSACYADMDTIQYTLLKSAISIVSSEQRIVFMQLKYPSLSDKPNRKNLKSPLYLSKQFTPTDLMELVTALQLSGAIRRADSTPSDLTTLVEQMSWIFNVHINNPDQCRYAILARKLRLTRFLDLLRNNLIEYSQR